MNPRPASTSSRIQEAEIYLAYGAGGQAALSGKTLKEMGSTNVKNIGDWESAGGPMGGKPS